MLNLKYAILNIYFSKLIIYTLTLIGLLDIQMSYLDELIEKPLLLNDPEASTLYKLLVDRYGNYIIQRAITCFPREKSFILCSQLVPILNSLKDNNIKKLLLKIRKMFPELDKTSPAPKISKKKVFTPSLNK